MLKLVKKQDEQKTEFVIGKSYFANSVCDQNCIWTFEVIKRTAKTITIKNTSPGYKSEISRKGIRVYNNQEMIFPLGKYSMAPILTASKLA